MDPEDFDPKTFFKFHGTWDARASSVRIPTEITLFSEFFYLNNSLSFGCYGSALVLFSLSVQKYRQLLLSL